MQHPGLIGGVKPDLGEEEVMERVEWKTKNGTTLKELQEAAAERIEGEE